MHVFFSTWVSLYEPRLRKPVFTDVTFLAGCMVRIHENFVTVTWLVRLVTVPPAMEPGGTPEPMAMTWATKGAASGRPKLVHRPSTARIKLLVVQNAICSAGNAISRTNANAELDVRNERLVLVRYC